MAKREPTHKQPSLALSTGVASQERKPPVPFVPGPNPGLPALLKSLNQVVDDTYDVGSFDHDIVVNKAAQPKSIYDMHMYWSKKHWGAIREYIRHYLPKKFY